eukprot:53085-Eustigmatos_ZCMA.PRE.1
MPVAVEVHAKNISRTDLVKTAAALDRELTQLKFVPVVRCGDSDPVFLSACLRRHRRTLGLTMDKNARVFDHPLMADVVVP